MPLSAEQRENARVIIRVGEGMGLDDQTVTAALATAFMESGLRNLKYGDRDSLGLFQQRPSQGWGTADQINDPEYAAKRFFQAFTRSKGSTVLERIANTQRPAAQYRGDYAKHFGAAQAAFSEVAGRAAPQLDGGSVERNVVPTDINMSTPIAATRNPIVAAAPSNPEQVDAYIRKNYPTVAGLLDIPEVKKILEDAARGQLDDTEVEARLRGTDYWKTNGPAARKWKILQAEDPAGAQQQFYRTVAALKAAGGKVGAELTDADLFTTASDFLNGGWNEAEVNGFLARRIREQNTGGFPEGESRGLTNSKTASDADALGKTAKQYGVPLSRAALEEWATKMLEGTATKEGFTSYVTGMAKSRWLQDKDVIAALDAGVAPETYFDSYRQTIANTLELNPDSVDILGDRRFSGVTQMYDEKTGSKRAMTLGEAENWARQQTEYADTKAYKKTAADFTMNLAKTFGGI